MRDGHWLLLPQIKIRNARGDRVVESQEFFRSQGFEDADEPREFELKHEAEFGGFRLLATGIDP